MQALQRALALVLLVTLVACSMDRQPITAESSSVPSARESAAASATAADPTATPASAAPEQTPVAATGVAEEVTPAPPEEMSDGVVNLAHLNFLSEEVEIAGQPQLLTHIYAEAPKYTWVDASGEGIACVDDVARAVIVYLDFFDRTQNPRALERARAGLNFVRYLQVENGQFYNFVQDRSGTINRTGTTSFQSLGWWAYRGMWALARGYTTFRDADPAYASELQAAYLRTERALAAYVRNTGRTSDVHGFTVPAWLPDGAADQTGVAVLALAEYQAANPNPETEALLTMLADALRDYQLGGPGEYPWGMHPHSLSTPGFWHAWGSHEAQALARAGEVLRRDDYVDSARRELDNFFAWQLATERVQEIGALPFRQGQQAYGTNSIVQAAINVYRATGDVRYARMGGLHATWFTGNNMAKTAMYDPATGRGYDGIDRELAVNLNAGAESTIEALMAMQAVAAVPEAAKYLDYRPTEATSWRVFEAENAEEIAGSPRYGNRGWTGEARFGGDRFYELKSGDVVDLAIDVPADGEYLLYAAQMRRAAASSGIAVQALSAAAPPTIDGQSDEWQGVPAVAADQRQQILRGAEGWRGAETDSFTLRTQWDARNLYVLAEVRDPEHEQTGQGPGVGSGDTLWLYLDTEGGGSRIGSKLTLAQTPAGPEVWDWKAGFPLPNAQLAWRAVDGGYVYEAALSWESLRARSPEAGKQMRIEAGRSFGGNSFMDLGGGDPDSAANLVPLQLVAEAAAGEAGAQATATAGGDATSIALGVAVDGGEPLVLPQAVSPDRDYLWLDLVTPAPITLTAGAHTLRLSYAGNDPQGSTIVDGFLLQPAIATKTLSGAAGQVRLRFDMLKGELAIDE